MEGKIHQYHPARSLILFEHSPLSFTPLTHALILIGGIGDGLINLPYTEPLAQALPVVGFHLFNIQLSSSNLNWGVNSIAQDVSEMATAVAFVCEKLLSGSKGGKVVIMGSSTGAQDVLTYLSTTTTDGSPNPLPAVDGAILQAPVADREALRHMTFETVDAGTKNANLAAYDECIALCKQAQKNATGDAERSSEMILPLALTNKLGHFGTQMTCSRFLSCWSPDSPANPGPDDMFSSDLSSETLASTFGAIGRQLKPSWSGKPELLILHSGADEFHPPHISQTGLLERWEEMVQRGGAKLASQSGICEGSRHNGAGNKESEVKGKMEIVRRVVEYIDGLVKGT